MRVKLDSATSFLVERFCFRRAIPQQKNLARQHKFGPRLPPFSNGLHMPGGVAANVVEIVATASTGFHIFQQGRFSKLLNPKNELRADHLVRSPAFQNDGTVQADGGYRRQTEPYSLATWGGVTIRVTIRNSDSSNKYELAGSR